jgi:hypothetical protein
MLNAIQGIGAGGSRASETSLVAKGNAALYSCFAVFGIFSGSVINTIGPKIPLMLYVPLLSSLLLKSEKEESKENNGC